MKHYKLLLHPKNYEISSDLLINAKDFPDLKLGDIVEIYHPEDEYSRLLLQIIAFKEEFQHKDAISVEQSIAQTFQLRSYSEVLVNKVDRQSVSLNSVELIFKDQYIGRSEMWRLKTNLINTCVYLNKKIEFCGGTARFQVYEMWSHGEKVACGVINEDTKLIFRSLTCMMYLFVQMSSEMWEFDAHGDMYFEKTVGFLSELFQKWKKHSSNHEVTIVLFSRVFYKAANIEEFAEHARQCMQKDYKGRIYQDFYRVAIQNEKYDDWCGTLQTLQSLFADYRRSVLEYHKRPAGSSLTGNETINTRAPYAYLSSSAHGNFLEVLNISLNVFDKHYLERSLDRTGQSAVVISPGVGVFEVDRELTNVTKQRIIDNGIGCDLVCLGEQPLHAVPLFKFHNKDAFVMRDDFSMPHWINLSFYATNKKLAYSEFVPRIRLPLRRSKTLHQSNQTVTNSTKFKLKLPTEVVQESILPGNGVSLADIDYDDYDDQIFALPTSHVADVQKIFSRTKKISLSQQQQPQPTLQSQLQTDNKCIKWKLSDPDIYRSNLSSSFGACGSNGSNPTAIRSSSVTAAISTDTIDGSIISIGSGHPRNYSENEKFKNADFYIEDDSSSTTYTTTNSSDASPISSVTSSFFAAAAAFAGSSTATVANSLQNNYFLNSQASGGGGYAGNSGAGLVLTANRALINPFDTSHVTVKVTSNRRRWTHVFPKGPAGIVMQRHHRQCQDYNLNRDSKTDDGKAKKISYSGAKLSRNYEEERISPTTMSDVSSDDNQARSKLTNLNFGSPSTHFSQSHFGSVGGKKSQTLLWGVTGEQRWTPALTTGVDWKSLVIPACLPITTDYFPDEVCLKTDYVFSDYNLLPDDVNADYARKRAIYREPLTTSQVFNELVSQRLAQGFQLIVDTESSALIPSASTSACASTGNSSSSTTANVTTQNTSSSSSTIVSRTTPKNSFAEYKLSIGRIFHKITLRKSEIRITRYRPRHPYPPFVIQYRYRFRAPDHRTYGSSWSSFTAEILENFNWNYLDHYICTRGDTDFSLIESCKYWRFRIYALPALQAGTKKILEGSSRCDVYAPYTIEEKNNLLGGFLRFIESPVNKIRRKDGQKYQKTGTVQNCPFRERYGSTSREKMLRPRSGSKTLEKQKGTLLGDISSTIYVANASNIAAISSNVSVAATIAATNTSISMSSSLTSSFDNDNEPFDAGGEFLRLKENVSDDELIEAFRHNEQGVGFLSQYPSLPSYTFISYDAVQWLKNHVEGISNDLNAISRLEDLQKKRFICHASGDISHPFIFGSYLYYIPPSGTSRKESSSSSSSSSSTSSSSSVSRGQTVADKTEHIEPIRDLITFRNEWAEVETLPVLANNTSFSREIFTDALPAASPPCTSETYSLPAYKQTHIEVDLNNKSDRIEWGHARYQSVYNVDAAFELIIEWVAASGPIVSDLIYSLARRAQTYNLQLVPVPADPHALPNELKSDPLRGPVFIPLNTYCLRDDNGEFIFEGFSRKTRNRRMVLLLEKIAALFGFIRCGGNPNSYRHHYSQFVHLTGNIFLLIVTPADDLDVNELATPLRVFTKSSTEFKSRDHVAKTDSNEVISPHLEYISRHVTNENNDEITSHNFENGYLWSWNHMIGRRWKGSNAATNDEAFQDKLLLDFRQFCSNSEGRLSKFCNNLRYENDLRCDELRWK